MRKLLIFVLVCIVVGFGVVAFSSKQPGQERPVQISRVPTVIPTPTPSQDASFPMAISALRSKQYPGSFLTVEQTIPDGSNYHRYVVSYLSDGLKIYALLTVPIGQKPQAGWPVIVINHGYIPPTEYETVSSYASVVVPFAENGYIVLKPDYRGNGNSEGTPTQVYVSEGYVTDSMNAIASIKKYKDANPQKIGIWGHSMGGNVTLHEMVIPASVQAVDIWSGVVGTYTNILSWWDNRVATGVLTTQNDLQTLQLVRQFTKTHGTPDTNPQFWQAIDPTDYLSKVQSPVLIQVGTGDTVVPPDFSSTLYASLKQLGKNVQFVSYPGADHNLAPDSTSAMGAVIAFFNTFLK